MEFGMATAFAAPLYSPCTNPVRSVRLVRTKMLLRVRIVRANSKKADKSSKKTDKCPKKEIKGRKTMIFYQELREMRTNLEKRRNVVRLVLADCLSGYLLKTKSAGRTEFIHIYYENGIRRKKRIKENSPEAVLLIRKRCLETEKSILDNNIGLLDTILKGFIPTSAGSIMAGIPENLREYFPTVACTATAYANEEMLKWAEADYEQSSFMPEAKIHTTSWGLKVRSKSELLLAEKYREKGIPFRYEQVIHIGKDIVVPDFTLLRVDMKLFYHEHCGMPGNKKYMDNHKRKLEIYESIGIVPWDNLIVTYDSKDGNLDLKIIESEINNRLIL